jgi:hypothetical protein
LTGKFEWPFCAQCGRGVDKVERRLDYWSGDVLYVVKCHGMQTTQRVADLDLHDVVMIAATSSETDGPL